MTTLEEKVFLMRYDTKTPDKESKIFTSYSTIAKVQNISTRLVHLVCLPVEL